MAKTPTEWQTPNEIRKTLGEKKCKSLIEDLVQEEKNRSEILEKIMGLANCNKYSADDFLRNLLNNPT